MALFGFKKLDFVNFNHTVSSFDGLIFKLKDDSLVSGFAVMYDKPVHVGKTNHTKGTIHYISDDGYVLENVAGYCLVSDLKE
jgi:hypothetical protein